MNSVSNDASISARRSTGLKAGKASAASPANYRHDSTAILIIASICLYWPRTNDPHLCPERGSGVSLLGGAGQRAHVRTDEEAPFAPVVEREHSAAPRHDVDQDVGVFPRLILRSADVKRRAADLAHFHVVVADQELALGIAHGRGAVAAPAGLMEHHRTVVGDNLSDQD